MAHPILFDIRRGDVTLTATTLSRIQSGTLTLYLVTETAEVKLDAASVSAIQAGAKTLNVLHSVHGHRALNAAVLNNLT